MYYTHVHSINLFAIDWILLLCIKFPTETKPIFNRKENFVMIITPPLDS